MRSPAALIAFRYFKGRRGINAAPLLARISMLALAVGSAAMIILFSVFNGFEQVIGDLYKAFYSDLRITPATGKFFELSPEKMQSLRGIQGIERIAPVLEDNVFVRTEDEQIVVTLRGITPDYTHVNDLEPYLVAGRDSVRAGALPTAIAGMHIAARLGLSTENPFSRLTVYYPRLETANPTLNPLEAVSSLELRPDGVFKVQEEFDARYVLADLSVVQELFNTPGKWSSLEMRLKPGTRAEVIQNKLRKLLGKDFIVETRYEQNHTLNTVMRTEKWATYVILLFILLIASVNMIGAMTLLVLEKSKDMALLTSLGARNGVIRGIFIWEGLFWAATGGFAGLLMGALICLGQKQWGWVKLSGDFIIPAYPVALKASDFVVIAITVLAVGALATLYPAVKGSRKQDLSVI
jgi:lipoprotein-releasing system permease protein